ncbi:MAG: hypothetical protein M1832_001328 [Thelocarpon impressellum]|nr:MAG: hypothetical protein M1832_001328 [Thelocarpon impressellum]
MTDQTLHLHTSLLRPPVLQILRAAGYHSARPSVVDTLVELAARYMLLLAGSAAGHSAGNVSFPEPQLEDVRMAMQDCGVFRPQMTAVEEQWHGEEDTRGLDAFLDWVRGAANREIRRIAGMEGNAEGSKDVLDVDGAGEDFLTALKKKHSKTGEESRYQGTVLGKSGEDRPVRIEGGQAASVQEWAELQRQEAREPSSPGASSASSSLLSSAGPATSESAPATEDEHDGDSVLAEV